MSEKNPKRVPIRRLRKGKRNHGPNLKSTLVNKKYKKYKIFLKKYKNDYIGSVHTSIIVNENLS